MRNILLSITAFIFSFFSPTNGLFSGLSETKPTPSAPTVPLVTPISTPTSSPTPRPLTFSEMNNLYGPCVSLPSLMYHHIQSEESAKANKQTGLSVYTNIFKEQMQYLKDRNYNVLGAQDLVNFMKSGVKTPSRSILLTFDDGYNDFYTDAYPILKSIGFKAIMFTPTGLINNPGYLNWDQISEMNANNIFFANHTWSHRNVAVAEDIMKKEISTADLQLTEHNLNNPKVFAYPYGIDNTNAESYLNTLGYNFAFTTKPGSILCQKQKFDLPRIRIGNRPLKSYGF